MTTKKTIEQINAQVEAIHSAAEHIKRLIVLCPPMSFIPPPAAHVRTSVLDSCDCIKESCGLISIEVTKTVRKSHST